MRVSSNPESVRHTQIDGLHLVCTSVRLVSMTKRYLTKAKDTAPPVIDILTGHLPTTTRNLGNAFVVINQTPELRVNPVEGQDVTIMVSFKEDVPCVRSALSELSKNPVGISEFIRKGPGVLRRPPAGCVCLEEVPEMNEDIGLKLLNPTESPLDSLLIMER